MKSLQIVAGLVLYFLATVAAAASSESTVQRLQGEEQAPLQSFISGGEYQIAVMCFKTGENISGMNKICFYDCLGSATAITINSTSLCPLSINR